MNEGEDDSLFYRASFIFIYQRGEKYVVALFVQSMAFLSSLFPSRVVLHGDQSQNEPRNYLFANATRHSETDGVRATRSVAMKNRNERVKKVGTPRETNVYRALLHGIRGLRHNGVRASLPTLEQPPPYAARFLRVGEAAQRNEMEVVYVHL